VARRAGLEISFHTLRHSHASLLLKMEENLKVISERLGHSGIRITVDTYAHLYSDAQKGAARKIATVLPMGI
jgi:integrase